MKMNRNFGSIVLALLAALLLLPAASANSVSDDAVITAKGEIRAGITPDSPLHFFERSMDRMRLAFTADPERKAEKAMEIARERLMEAKKMAEKGDAKAAGKAQRLHGQMLAKIEDSSRKISDDSRTRLEKEIRLESELEEHKSEIESVESIVKSKLGQRRGSSDSIEAVNLLGKLKVETERVRAEVEKEKENSIARLKLETGQSDDDIRQIVRGIEDGVSGSSRRGSDGRGEIELSEDDRTRIQARVFDDFTRIKVEIDFSTLSEDRNAILGEMLSRARLSREEIDRLLDLRAEEHPEDASERLRTEAKVKDDKTEAELELEFPINARDREAIVNAVFNKLNSLSIGELDAAMRIEDRRGFDDDDNELADRRRGADDDNDVNDARGREAEARGREAEGEAPRGADDNGVNDVRGREAEARGREAEGEAPRGADSPSDFDSTPGSRGGSGSGGSSSDD